MVQTGPYSTERQRRVDVDPGSIRRHIANVQKWTQKIQ